MYKFPTRNSNPQLPVAWTVPYTLRTPDGNLNVPYLNWNGDRWKLYFNWLDNDWNADDRLVRRNSLHL